jgi:protein-arginine kinase activator protein McsA
MFNISLFSKKNKKTTWDISINSHSNLLQCPNCKRTMPNLQFKRKNGCKWCKE